MLDSRRITYASEPLVAMCVKYSDRASQSPKILNGEGKLMKPPIEIERPFIRDKRVVTR
ncbi:MAG: hypothetical protein LDL41_21285 [Coleofasciculus sp. S288]|nr:hypothetical protein [Coleofasciculus sp. S288]